MTVAMLPDLVLGARLPECVCGLLMPASVAVVHGMRAAPFSTLGLYGPPSCPGQRSRRHTPI